MHEGHLLGSPSCTFVSFVVQVFNDPTVTTATDIGSTGYWVTNSDLQRDREPVANGQDRGVELLGVVKLSVELQNRLGGRVRIFLRDPAAPQNVVGDKQASLA